MILNSADSTDAQEAASGLRFCRDCKTLIPLSQFMPGQRIFKCRSHFLESRRKLVSATPIKRSLNCVRAKSHQDLAIFGQKAMSIGSNEIRLLLTTDQLLDSSKVSIVPVDPCKPLSVSNCVVITTDQRREVINGWRKNHDAKAYMEEIENITKKAQIIETS
jgi:hypothetical protein